jgi:hypothetical protein
MFIWQGVSVFGRELLVKKKKNQNLQMIVAAEIVLAACVCIGVVGVFIYAGGPQLLATSGNPPAEASATPVALIETATQPAPPTEIPTATVTPEPKGSLIEKQADGTTKFTDLDGDYEITFPKGWLAVHLGNEEEYNNVVKNEGAKNEMLVEQMGLNKKKFNLEFDRVMIYPLRPDIEKNALFGFSKIAFDASSKLPISNNTLGDWVREFDATSIAPDLRVTESDIVVNGNKMVVMTVKGRYSVKSTPLVVVVWFFKPTPHSVVRVTFTLLQNYYDVLVPDVDAVRESIKLIGQ